MAGKLLKENIPVERLVGQGSAQATAETSVMLSGGDRNVTIVSCRALPSIGTVEVQTGGVAVQGTTEFSALYLTQAGELFSRDAQASFSAVLQVEDAAPKMRATVRATVCSVEAEERDGRMDFSAALRLEGFVAQPAVEALATSVEAPVAMAEKTVRLETLNQVAYAQEREAFAENFPLADPSYTRVVSADARVQVDNVNLQDGEVEVTGSVTVDSLLSGAEAGGPVGWQSETLPFSEEIEGDGFRPGVQVSVSAHVRGLKSEVVFNREDEVQEGNLRIEFVLELAAEAKAEAGAEVLADAYPLTEDPFQVIQEDVRCIRSDEAVEQTQTLLLEVEIPASAPGLGEILGAFAAPVALDIVGEESARAEGLMRVSLLYRTGSEVPLAVYTREAPFALEFSEIDGQADVSAVELGEVAAERVSQNQAQVRIPLTLRAERVGTADVAVVSEISEEGEPAALPVGAVLYYPKPEETLWEVARRYRIAEEELRKRNPEGKSPVLVYRRLTSF
ncbi:MAG: SPOCS domain-containing protein [Candidatus Spyradocola sp.]|jgi:hypothetical protein